MDGQAFIVGKLIEREREPLELLGALGHGAGCGFDCGSDAHAAASGSTVEGDPLMLASARCGPSAFGTDHRGDLVEPRPQALWVVNPFEHFVGTDEGLLKRIIGLRMGWRVTPTERPHD